MMVAPAVDDATKTTYESLVLPEEILVFPVRVRFLPVVTTPDSSTCRLIPEEPIIERQLSS